MSSYSRVSTHRGMVYDSVRNSAYASALEALVKPGSVVLDLGSGLGLHGLMAAAKGARHVYLVDPSPVTAMAAQVAAENGLADKVTCIQKTIEQAVLPEKVDVIVSVLTGNFLLEEDLLPSLFFAREKYLKPFGVMIPDVGEMRAVPVSAETYFEKHVSGWSAPAEGINFSAVRKHASNTVWFDHARSLDVEFLAQPGTLASLDFRKADKAGCSSEIHFMIKKTGLCHAFLGWFRMRLGSEWLSTSPLKPAMHWPQVFLPMDPPLQLRAGDRLSFRLVRPEFGDWSWISSHAGKQQQHSTFFSRFFSKDQLRTVAKDQVVKLNETGELTQFVLEQISVGSNVQTIIDRTGKRFARQFSSPADLERRIRSLIMKFGLPGG